MFKEIIDPLKVLGKNYKRNNPNILKHIENSIKKGEPFHYLFTGVVGCGKTHLARKVTIVTSEMWEAVKVINFYKKYVSLMGSDYADKWSGIKSLDNISKSECLVIDDLGDEKPSTEAARDYFAGFLESRYEYICKNKNSRTIITTNYNADKIKKAYGSRVYDRIQEHFVICKFKAESFRAKNRTVISQ
tara:strand:- start:620 stop:1186 length:567 start_codon:yes stop_codon:yes gene_type:complete